MGQARYPEQVHKFRKWSEDMIKGARVDVPYVNSNSSTGLAGRRKRPAARRRRKLKRKKNASQD